VDVHWTLTAEKGDKRSSTARTRPLVGAADKT
jgi:hypothetical protein